VDGYEYDRWGTYHRADHRGIGIDRSSNGTGYSGQYNFPLNERYNKIETCPEEYLLFFHYVDYKSKLASGKTIIQHIYDTHFEGVEDVEKMDSLWASIQDLIDPAAYNRVVSRLEEQLMSAYEWRDVINSYFFRKSGIKDEKDRMIY
jgi:alpha-glucuronidase